MNRLLRRVWAFIDGKAAWAFPDEKSRRLLLRALLAQLLCAGLLYARGCFSYGFLTQLLVTLPLAIAAVLHLVQYPFILISAAMRCFEVRGRKQRLPLEPWVLRSRLTVLALLVVNSPLWWLLVKALWRAGVYNALLTDD